MEQRNAAAAGDVDDGENCHVIDIHVVDVSVVLAKAGGDPTAVLSSSTAAPPPTSSTVGSLDDAQQDEAAAVNSAACNKDGRPSSSKSFFHFFQPLVLFIMIFGAMTALGAIVGNAYAQETKHMALKVLAYVLSICVANTLPAFGWCRCKYCEKDDDR